MPFARIDLLKGKPPEYRATVADVVYQEQGRKDQAIGVGFGDDAANLAAADAASRMRPRPAPDEETPDTQTPDEQASDPKLSSAASPAGRHRKDPAEEPR